MRNLFFKLSTPKTVGIKSLLHLYHKWILTLSWVVISIFGSLNAQNSPIGFEIGARAGYDVPLFNMPYNELSYSGGLYLEGYMAYYFHQNIGVKSEYANISSQPKTHIPDQVFYLSTPFTTATDQIKVQRHFVGLGPSIRYSIIPSKIDVTISPLAGYSWISGGDIKVTTPANGDIQLINTGYKDASWSAKMDVDFSYKITDKFKVNMGLYYLRHFAVDFDDILDIDNSSPSVYHGENAYDHTTNPYTVSSNPANVFWKEDNCCSDLSSVGITAGLSYTFGQKQKKTSKCNTCGCPNDTHKVVVTVRDDASKQVIPEADVAIKDMAGNIIATGTTNSFGVVDFGQIHHDNYIVTGNVLGIETTTASIYDEEFTPNAVIQKEILYTDLRFILKGVTINKNKRKPEPDVLVSLTNEMTGRVAQDNSNSKGAFVFRLDKNSSYKVVGKKDNRLSEIEKATTVGLTRSTTLFVDLELGMDNIECGKGTVLDIKYEFDKDRLTAASQLELDRLVQYMRDHNVARVELSSHTDSRGTHAYNQDLSERRAQSAVNYIVAQGIPSTRIFAKGYGETQLLNRCKDGVNCSEEQHLVNRRTEAKLLCN